MIFTYCFQFPFLNSYIEEHYHHFFKTNHFIQFNLFVKILQIVNQHYFAFEMNNFRIKFISKFVKLTCIMNFKFIHLLLNDLDFKS